ncbi:MAG: WG repeat-containing protein [Oscillospiraceae bacterium]|nr:WG repeat-containing protein [Oscillospiraceae bacterium]
MKKLLCCFLALALLIPALISCRAVHSIEPEYEAEDSYNDGKLPYDENENGDPPYNENDSEAETKDDPPFDITTIPPDENGFVWLVPPLCITVSRWFSSTCPLPGFETLGITDLVQLRYIDWRCCSDCVFKQLGSFYDRVDFFIDTFGHNNFEFLIFPQIYYFNYSLIHSVSISGDLAAIPLCGERLGTVSAWGVVNSDGEIKLPFIFDHIQFIADGVAFVRFRGETGIMHITRTIELGAFGSADFTTDENGFVWIVPPQFDYEWIVHDGDVNMLGDEHRQMVWEHVGQYQKIICSNTGQLIFGHGIDGRCGNSRIGYDPITGKIIVSALGFDYDPVTPEEFVTSPELAWRQMPNVFRVELIDSTQRQPNLNYYGDGFILTCEAFLGKFALFRGAAQLTDFVYTSGNTISGDSSNGYLAMERIDDGMWGIYNPQGEIVIPFIFEHIVMIGGGRAFVRQNGLYGIMHIGLSVR